MMTSKYDNEKRGVLFNAKKKTEKHPDMTGNVVIDGVEYWLSAWKKVSNSGQEYISLSIGEPKEQRIRLTPSTPPADDIPF